MRAAVILRVSCGAWKCVGACIGVCVGCVCVVAAVYTGVCVYDV